MSVRRAIVGALALCLAACVESGPDDVAPLRFVQHDYIDLDQIARISRFRSGVGHDYADDFESCRSMKHYFVPRDEVDAATIVVRSPVDGVLTDLREEWAGTQLRIEPVGAPEYAVVLFHVRLDRELKAGDRLAVGDRIGTHIGSETWSDVAVEQRAAGGRRRLVSYFDVMAEDVFARYAARGVPSREALVISVADRDAEPLTCGADGRFGAEDPGDWVVLDPP